MKVLYKNISLLLFIVLFSSVTTCKKVEKADEKSGFTGRSIQVVTTTGMIADIAKNVGGDRVIVTSLMGPGVDPHLFKASEGDVARMARADIIFYNGLHLEGKMTEIFEKMGPRVKTVAVSDGVDGALLLSISGYQGSYDPHIWFDVTLWMQAARHVMKTMMVIDPDNDELYLSNTKAYLKQLEDLHMYVKSRSETLDPGDRVLITAHDAFHYFGKQYGFEVRGLQGISTAAEAGTSDVQELAKYIVGKKIPAIFVETSVPPRFIEALQAAVKSRGFNVSVGGNLYSDAMGTPGTPDGSYIGMVRHNIDTIVDALSRTGTQE